MSAVSRWSYIQNMTRAEKDIAIHRLQLPAGVFRKMPPPRFRELSTDEINLVVTELQK